RPVSLSRMPPSRSDSVSNIVSCSLLLSLPGLTRQSILRKTMDGRSSPGMTWLEPGILTRTAKPKPAKHLWRPRAHRAVGRSPPVSRDRLAGALQVSCESARNLGIAVARVNDTGEGPCGAGNAYRRISLTLGSVCKNRREVP